MTPSSSRSTGCAPALLDSAGFRAAVIGSFTKLAPQHASKNPVMAVVWLGTLLTAGLTLAGMSTPGTGWAGAWNHGRTGSGSRPANGWPIANVLRLPQSACSSGAPRGRSRVMVSSMASSMKARQSA